MEFNWQNVLDNASEVGASYLTARNRPRTAEVGVPAPRLPPEQPWLKWALIGGGALAVVGVLIAVLKK